MVETTTKIQFSNSLKCLRVNAFSVLYKTRLPQSYLLCQQKSNQFHSKGTKTVDAPPEALKQPEGDTVKSLIAAIRSKAYGVGILWVCLYYVIGSATVRTHWLA